MGPSQDEGFIVIAHDYWLVGIFEILFLNRFFDKKWGVLVLLKKQIFWYFFFFKWVFFMKLKSLYLLFTT